MSRTFKDAPYAVRAVRAGGRRVTRDVVWKSERVHTYIIPLTDRDTLSLLEAAGRVLEVREVWGAARLTVSSSEVPWRKILYVTGPGGRVVAEQVRDVFDPVELGVGRPGPWGGFLVVRLVMQERVDGTYEYGEFPAGAAPSRCSCSYCFPEKLYRGRRKQLRREAAAAVRAYNSGLPVDSYF